MKEFDESKHPRDKYGKFTDKGGKTPSKLKNIGELLKKRTNFKISLKFFSISDKQFGKKIGKHAHELNLDVSNKKDREELKHIINNIMDNPEIVKKGYWRGQKEDVLFYIVGNDVVIAKQNNEFISILPGGVNNERIKNARVEKI